MSASFPGGCAAPRRPLSPTDVVRLAGDLARCVANDQLVRAKLILKNLSKAERQAVTTTKVADGNAPLFLAAQLGNVQFVNLLLDEGHANIEQRGTYEVAEDRSRHQVTPLWCAAVTNRLEVVRTLARHGADVDAPSDTQSTPVRSACYMTNTDVVRFLVDEAAADIHRPNVNGGTCLINAVQSAELCRFLVARGADVNAHDNSGNLALHYAIREGRLETVRLLIEGGSDPTARNDAGDDAVQSAALRGHAEILDYLLRETRPGKGREIEAWELMGTNAVDEKHDVAAAVDYWRLAMELRCSPEGAGGGGGRRAFVDGMSGATGVLQRGCGSNEEGEFRFDEERGEVSIGGASSMEAEYSDQSELPQSDRSSAKRRTIDAGALPAEIRDRYAAPAYRGAREPCTVDELLDLGRSADRVYTHALVLRERILGPGHKDTVFGLMYRGAVYADTRDYQRCVDLWKYAFALRHHAATHRHPRSLLTHEYLFTLQALCKLFWEISDEGDAAAVAAAGDRDGGVGGRDSGARGRDLDAGGPAEEATTAVVRFDDAYDVLEMTVIEVEAAAKMAATASKMAAAGAPKSTKPGGDTDGTGTDGASGGTGDTCGAGATEIVTDGAGATSGAGAAGEAGADGAIGAATEGPGERQDELLVLLQLTLHLVQLLVRLQRRRRSDADTFRLHRLLHRLVRVDVRLADGRGLLRLAADRRTASVAGEYYSAFPSAGVVGALLECGADPCIVDSAGDGALHAVARDLGGAAPGGALARQLAAIAHRLLTHGAHADAANRAGETAVAGLSQAAPGFNWAEHMTLRCLAARAVRAAGMRWAGVVPASLDEFILLH